MAINHDIARFDIPMHDPLFMSVRQGFYNLQNKLLNLGWGKPTLIQERTQIQWSDTTGPLYILHDKIKTLRRSTAFKDRHNVRMRKSRQSCGFPLKSLNKLLICGQRRHQKLNGHTPAKGHLTAFQYKPHATLAKRLPNLVASDLNLRRHEFIVRRCV